MASAAGAEEGKRRTQLEREQGAVSWRHVGITLGGSEKYWCCATGSWAQPTDVGVRDGSPLQAGVRRTSGRLVGHFKAMGFYCR